MKLGAMMRKAQAIWLAALATVSLSASAQASVVYSNGDPLGTNGLESTAWVTADDFNLGSGANLATAGVYFATPTGLSSWDGTVFWNIFADASGTPGASLASGGGVVLSGATTTAFTCSQCGNHPEVYLVEFALNNFVATAGTTYWLGIHMSSDFNDDGVYWMNAANNGTNNALSSQGGTFDNWTNFEVGQLAFYLTDASDRAVPEPSTWALMLFGFGAMGFALRRKQRTVAIS